MARRALPCPAGSRNDAGAGERHRTKNPSCLPSEPPWTNLILFSTIYPLLLTSCVPPPHLLPLPVVRNNFLVFILGATSQGVGPGSVSGVEAALGALLRMGDEVPSGTKLRILRAIGGSEGAGGAGMSLF